MLSSDIPSCDAKLPLQAAAEYTSISRHLHTQRWLDFSYCCSPEDLAGCLLGFPVRHRDEHRPGRPLADQRSLHKETGREGEGRMKNEPTFWLLGIRESQGSRWPHALEIMELRGSWWKLLLVSSVKHYGLGVEPWDSS